MNTVPHRASHHTPRWRRRLRAGLATHGRTIVVVTLAVIVALGLAFVINVT